MRYKVLFSLLIAASCSVQLSLAQSLSISRSFINAESAVVNQPSNTDTFSISMSGFSNDLRITTLDPFELSSDGLNFNDTLVISNSLSNTTITIHVRFIPSLADVVYRAPITFQDNNFTLNDKVYLMGNSMAPAQSLSVCSWNIKWFGLPSQCNCDTALSLKNAAALLKEINADVYALQEIASINHLQRLVQELGTDFSYIVADYCSQISDPTQVGYDNCQKLAYIYNNTKVSNEGSFGLLRSTYPAQLGINSPHYYFASGRWPLVLKAKLLNNSQEFLLVNMHGKAFAGSSEHNRRAAATVRMTDSLNTHFNNTNVVVLGDYNDLLEGAITTGFIISPYDYLLNNGFTGLSLPSLFPGEVTYIGSPGSIIDNISVSDYAALSIIPKATTIIREAELSIENYRNTTSDHLPIMTFLRTNVATKTNDISAIEKLFSLVNPSHSLSIQVPHQFINSNTSVSISNLVGERLWSKDYSKTERIHYGLDQFNSGIYIVSIQNGSHKESHKLFIR